MFCPSSLMIVNKAPTKPVETFEQQQVGTRPPKRRGLSRFYKAKARSFRDLSDALNTEYGESADALAKRVKRWHPDEDDSAGSRMSVPKAEHNSERQRDWLKKCTQETCFKLMCMSLSSPHAKHQCLTTTSGIRGEERVFRIGSTANTKIKGNVRSRGRPDRSVRSKGFTAAYRADLTKAVWGAGPTVRATGNMTAGFAEGWGFMRKQEGGHSVGE